MLFLYLVLAVRESASVPKPAPVIKPVFADLSFLFNSEGRFLAAAVAVRKFKLELLIISG